MELSKSWRLPALALIAALALAACGGGDDGGEDGEDGGGTETVSADAYVEEYCGGLTTWQDAAQQHATELQERISEGQQPEERRELAGDYVDSLIGDTEELLSTMEEAGVPDIDNGQEFADEFIENIQTSLDQLGDIRGEVDSLPVDDPAGFEEASDALGDRVEAAINEVSAGLSDISVPELDQAFSESSTCQSIQVPQS